MTWDTTAVKVGIKAIAQVEASMNYGAINPTDPISVGIFQWFGTRAAAILVRMQTENSAVLPSSIAASLTAHSPSDSYWDTRYLTKAESNALSPILITNQPIQDNQAGIDLDGYRAVGVAQGIDQDANTKTLLFFCNMYNQGPKYALRVLANAGPSSSLDRIYAVCLNDPVLGQYRSRYQTVYNTINTMDYSGVGDTTGSGGGSTDPGGNPSTGGTRPTTDITYIKMVGDSVTIRYKDGHALMCWPNGSGIWIPNADTTIGATVPGSGGTPTGTATDLISWLTAHNNAFAYSQGAGRLNPIASGYTDCSGLMYYDFLANANIDIGTWTGDQSKHGTLVTTDPTAASAGTGLLPGDLVFYRWHSSSPSTFDHVAMYIGSDHIESHGGPDPGPDLESHSGAISSAIAGGGSIMVRRYL